MIKIGFLKLVKIVEMKFLENTTRNILKSTQIKQESGIKENVKKILKNIKRTKGDTIKNGNSKDRRR